MGDSRVPRSEARGGARGGNPLYLARGHRKILREADCRRSARLNRGPLRCYPLRPENSAAGLEAITKTAWKKYLAEATATVAINHPEVSAGDPAPGTPVHQSMPSAPVDEICVVPAGWKLLTTGVYRVSRERDEEVLSSPL